MAGKYAASHSAQKLLEARKYAKSHEMTSAQRKQARERYDRQQQLARRHGMSIDMAEAVGAAYRGGQGTAGGVPGSTAIGGKTMQLIRWILHNRQQVPLPPVRVRGMTRDQRKKLRGFEREHRDWVPPDEPTG